MCSALSAQFIQSRISLGFCRLVFLKVFIGDCNGRGSLSVRNRPDGESVFLTVNQLNSFVNIKIYREASLVILQIINTGKGMTEEEIKRVESILNDRPDQKAGRKNSHESLGIHNVNERIKLIYGKEYGLTIRPISDGETASTITIPYEYLQEDETAEPQRNTALNKLG
jgi:hypothetical protein